MMTLVFSCFLYLGKAEAQFSPTSSNVPIYPTLVSEAEAESLLLAEIPALESSMNQQQPNTNEYKLAEKKYLMYVHTWENLTSGLDVETALTSTYGEYASDTNGVPLNEDELATVVSSKEGGYGDQVFEDLVAFLED